MRLALATETYPPEVNGVAMTLGRLVEGLRRRGWRTQLVRPLQEGECLAAAGAEELLVPGLPIPGYESLRMGRPAALLMSRRWVRWRPDIVHVATEGPLGLAALVAAKRLGLPVSSTFHTNFHQYGRHYRLGFLRDAGLCYLRAFHNACGCALAPTRQMAEELVAAGFRGAGALSRGADTALFDPAKRDPELRASWGAGKDGLVFLYVGRVAKEKNIGLAAEAFRRARRVRPEAAMAVVGDGPELAALKEAYPEINFCGMRQGEDLARHYASCDVFLFPSETETFGNVVAEAMASGLAVVAYDYAAGRERIRSGENGCLAPLGEADAFLSQAEEAARWKETTLARLRRAARETALAYGWDRVVERFESALVKTRRLHYRPGPWLA